MKASSDTLILPSAEIIIPQPTRVQVLMSATTLIEQPTVQLTATAIPTPTPTPVSSTVLANALRVTLPDYTAENVRRTIDIIILTFVYLFAE